MFMHTHTCKRTRISFTCEICFSVIPGIVLRRSSASRHRSSKIIGFDVSFILGIESKKATTKNEHMCLIIIIVCVMISIFECYTKILFLRKWKMVMLYDAHRCSRPYPKNAPFFVLLQIDPFFFSQFFVFLNFVFFQLRSLTPKWMQKTNREMKN